MTDTTLDQTSLELHEMAEAYAAKAEALASDPYFREAVLKTAVSSFAWALYHKFNSAMDRWCLDHEMQVQTAAVGRAVLASSGSVTGDRWPKLQWIDHVQVAIPPGGEDRARPFYAGLLGLPEQPKPPELARRGGCWFESERVKVHCGIEEPFTPARKAHIAFRVDDVAGLAAQARAAGYEVVDDDALEGHERVYIYDPFGNRLEFLRPLEI